MPAEQLLRFREVYDDGAILDAIVWRLPVPVPGCRHDFKYRLFYGYPGRRVIGFDNERGKGDHLHFEGREHADHFTTPKRLIDDFFAEVRRQRQ